MTSPMDPMGVGVGGDQIARRFADMLKASDGDHLRVLELGTKRWEANRPTHHKHWAPHFNRCHASTTGTVHARRGGRGIKVRAR